MMKTILLTLALILGMSTAALAGPKYGSGWQPCDYHSSWKTDSCS